MNSEQPYPPLMPQVPQPVFQTPIPQLYATRAPQTHHEKFKGQKIRIAFLATVAFVVFSNIGVYRAVNMFYNALTSRPNEVVMENGMPSMKGIVIHSSIFFIIVMVLLSKYA